MCTQWLRTGLFAHHVNFCMFGFIGPHSLPGTENLALQSGKARVLRKIELIPVFKLILLGFQRREFTMKAADKRIPGAIQ